MSNSLEQKQSADLTKGPEPPEVEGIIIGSNTAEAAETGAAEAVEARNKDLSDQATSGGEADVADTNAESEPEIAPADELGPLVESQSNTASLELEDVVPSDAVSDAQTDSAQETEPQSASDKIGIDANRPIDPKTGEIQPQVADPDVIASTGTRWVRLNFVLGPWSGPGDTTLHSGRTWAGAYQKIISGLRGRGLRIYGLIGAEAVPKDPGEEYRQAAPGPDVESLWMDRYVEHFVAIVEMFHEEIAVFESFNEPDDWHGRRRNWVHPSWFAVMLQRIHAAVRAKPELDHAKLVSGPLQGLQDNKNAAVFYLYNTYQAGKELFGWGDDDTPFPFDGVGYHIYVRGAYTPNREAQKRGIRSMVRRYLDAMHRVIRQEEGQDKPLYVSEVGWTSNVDLRLIKTREQFQAHSLKVGLATVVADPLVELGCYFCTQDFAISAGDMFYGLYRQGRPKPHARKLAFETFKALSSEGFEETAPEREYTNDEVIRVFYQAAVELELSSRWSLMSRAGLRLSHLAANRQQPYDGPPIEELPGLTEEEKELIQVLLDGQLAGATGRAATATLARLPSAGRLAPAEAADPAFELELSDAIQGHLLEQLEEINDRLDIVLNQQAQAEAPGFTAERILLYAGLVAFLVALAISLVSILLMKLVLP
jgi:hypothetical protein